MSYFLIYLIKSTVYLSLFYAFFLVAMRSTTFFRFNRVMLLLGTFVCMLLPCYTITVDEVEGVPLPMQILDEMLVLKTTDEQIETSVIELPLQETAPTASTSLLPIALLGIYFIGMLAYWFMVIRSFIEVWKMIASHPKQWKDGCWLVIIPEKIPSFSWSNYIVISEEDYRNYPQMLVHERMHYLCRHSYDILFFTIVHALHWFNPMVWLIRTELKQLHEFEADQGVINQGIDATQYQLLLVKKAVGKKLYNIANGFNHTKLQKRITMMIQEKTNGWERLKWLVTVPVVMGAMLVFAQPEVKDTLEEVASTVNQQSSNEEIASLKKFFKEEQIKTENRLRNPDGTIILNSAFVHQLRIKPNNEVLFAGNTLATDYKTAIVNYLRESQANNPKDHPHAIYIKYSAEAKEEIILQVLKDIKDAFDILRSEYSAQGVKDIESICPYWVAIEGGYKYYPDGIEITFTSADNSKTEVLHELNRKKYKELQKKYGRNAKVSFKVEKETPEWLFERLNKVLKGLFNHVEGSYEGQNILSTESKTYKGIEITLLDSKDGSVLASIKDIKHIDQLKEALKKFPVDRREPYTNVQLKAGKDTPMGAITEIKQALREHYILKLNMETKE